MKWKTDVGDGAVMPPSPVWFQLELKMKKTARCKHLIRLWSAVAGACSAKLPVVDKAPHEQLKQQLEAAKQQMKQQGDEGKLALEVARAKWKASLRSVQGQDER